MNKIKFIFSLVLFGILAQVSLLSGDTDRQIKQKIHKLLTTAEIFRDINLDSSGYYSQKAYSIAEHNNFEFELAEASYNMGITHCLNSEFIDGEQYLKKALKIQMELGNSKEIAILHNAFGQLYRFTSSYSKSLKHLVKACEIKEKLGDERSLAISYNNLGITYLELTSYPQALEYSERAYQISLRLKDTSEIVNSGITVANILYHLKKNQKALVKYETLLEMLNDDIQYKRSTILNNIANIYSEDGDFQTAEKYHKLCHDLAVASDDDYGEAITLLNLGEVYFKQKKYNDSEKYCLLSEQLSESINNEIGVADAVFVQGLIKEKIGLKDQAIKLFLRTMASYQSEGINSKLVATYKILHQLFAEKGEYETAYDFQNKFFDLQRLIIKKEKLSFEEAIVMKIESETEMKLLNIDLNNQKAQYEDLIRTIVITGILISLLIFVIILFFITKKKSDINKNKLAKKEEFQNSLYGKMSDELKTLLLYVSVDIAKLENKENYKNISASFAGFSKKYNRIISEMKINNN